MCSLLNTPLLKVSSLLASSSRVVLHLIYQTTRMIRPTPKGTSNIVAIKPSGFALNMAGLAENAFCNFDSLGDVGEHKFSLLLMELCFSARPGRRFAQTQVAYAGPCHC